MTRLGYTPDASRSEQVRWLVSRCEPLLLVMLSAHYLLRTSVVAGVDPGRGPGGCRPRSRTFRSGLQHQTAARDAPGDAGHRAADRHVARPLATTSSTSSRGTRSSASATRWCSVCAGPGRSSSSTRSVSGSPPPRVRRHLRSAARPDRRDRRVSSPASSPTRSKRPPCRPRPRHAMQHGPRPARTTCGRCSTPHRSGSS